LQTGEFVAKFLAARASSSIAYEPREDTFLLLESLSGLRLQGQKLLEVGTGSGILAAYCASKGADVTASDIDPGAIKELSSAAGTLGIVIRTICCDLFPLIDERFDIVVFNPPYLPSRGFGDGAVDGGKHGTATIKRFLSRLSEHLSKNGFALLLLSSLNDPEDLKRAYPGLGFEALRQESLFFETLQVFKVARREATKMDR
jgi:release factor glutamine methyltransferase